jgi:hypothetical protein
MKTKCAFRILKEAPDGIDFGETEYRTHHGILARGPGTGDKISLTWLIDEKSGWSDNGTGLSMYKLAIGEVACGMQREDPTFQSKFCIHLLTTRFQYYDPFFPYYQLRDLVFVSTL